MQSCRTRVPPPPDSHAILDLAPQAPSSPPLTLLICPTPPFFLTAPLSFLQTARPCSLVSTVTYHSGSSKLSATAQSAFVLDDRKTGTLISLAQLCDDDCLAIFTNYNVKILKHDEIIITDARLPNGLWSLPLQSKPSHQANGILRTDRPKRDLAVYHHATLGSPVPSTLLRAIRCGHLTTFPDLTTNLISKHLPASVATALGHQDQETKHLSSTDKLPVVLSPPAQSDVSSVLDDDLAPPLASRTHQLCAMLFSRAEELIKPYSDQTGKFPVPSSRGNRHYILFFTIKTLTLSTPKPSPIARPLAFELPGKKLISNLFVTVIPLSFIFSTTSVPRT